MTSMECSRRTINTLATGLLCICLVLLTGCTSFERFWGSSAKLRSAPTAQSVDDQAIATDRAPEAVGTTITDQVDAAANQPTKPASATVALAEVIPDQAKAGADARVNLNHAQLQARAPQNASTPAQWSTAAWVQVSSEPFQVEFPSPRWQHNALFAELERPLSQQPNWREELLNQDVVRATNAAIALARQGHHIGLTRLVATVRDQRLKLPLRQAAAEALALLPTVNARQQLRDLTLEFGQFSGANAAQYVPELHADLLTSLLRLSAVDGLPACRAALSSPHSAVRLAALRGWQQVLDEKLSPRVLDLAQDPVPAVRVLLVQLVALRQEPQAFELVSRAVRDPELPVKLAALTALGELGGEPARQLLKTFEKDPGELIRGAALVALVKLGDPQALQLTLQDKSAKVRKSLCQSLKALPNPALATELLQDKSSDVRQSMMQALSNWPWEQAAPLLIDSLENEANQVRQIAVQQLRDRWPPAQELSVTASLERLQEQALLLRAQLNRELSTTIESVNQATAQISDQIPIVFNSQAATWQKFRRRVIDQRATERRNAVLELARAIGELPCEQQVLQELHQVLEREIDSSVWLAALGLLAAQHDPAVGAIIALAASHQNDEVRRQSLNWFVTHPNAQYHELLMNSLFDDQVQVVQAALRAIAALPKLPDPQPIQELLSARDPAIRLAAAYALAAHGINPGYASLLRILYDQDPAMRRQAVVALGELGDIRSLSELIRLLDDRAEVQAAALHALRIITGFDPAQDERFQLLAGVISVEQASTTKKMPALQLTMPQQAKCWRCWYASQE